MQDTATGHSFSAEAFELPPQQTRLQELWAQLRKNRLALAGLVIFVVFFVVAVVGMLLTTGTSPRLDPSLVRLEEKLRPPLSRAKLEDLAPEEIPPLGRYLLGTDELGRDVFARMLQGAWVSLTVGFVAVGIAVIIGVILGGLSGYYGENPVRLGQVAIVFLLFLGVVNWSILPSGLPIVLVIASIGLAVIMVLQRKKQSQGPLAFMDAQLLSVDILITGLIDIMLCFPSFFLILTVVALLPASIYNIMIVIGLTSWMGAARFVRAEFLSLREQDFVTAARALGVSDWRIIFRHMVPNAIAPVLVSATIGIAGAILTEAGLSFLGFGVPPPHATWGNILSDGKNYLFDAPWLTFIPGIAILVVVLSFNLFGEGLRDILNPKLRERH
ncbi:MAG: ABC transporter permease [Deltaproteobacteria bacterium]|nr:ABC transporter permease [Deltaproteobacteria bacterium]